MTPPYRLARNLGRFPELFVAWQQTPAFRQLVARYLDIGGPPYPFDIPITGGGILRVGSRQEVKVFWEIYVRRCYRLPTECRIVVDAGANVGIFSVWAAKQVPEVRIIALEPFPATVAALRHNLHVNQLEERVQVVQVALGAQSGERLMRTDGESPQRGLEPADEEGSAGRPVIKVPCVSLADFFDRHRLVSVDMLKMDIQGSEWQVLLSAPSSLLRSIRRIQFEYHEVHARFGYTPERLFAHLTTAGHVLTFRREDERRTGLAIFDRV